MEWYWALLFALSSLFNFRAAFKLLLDWKGMLTTCRFVEAAYARLDELHDEAALEQGPGTPVFVQLVPAFQEPDIATTVRALLASRYPHGKLHVVVVTKEEEERSPHPAMTAPTAELVRRLRQELPPYQQKMLSHLAMPGPGRKAHQLNWALCPEHLRALLGEDYDPGRVWVGVSDADSIPDRNVYRWLAGDLASSGADNRAYQGVTLSLANFERLSVKGRVCAVQQSSIFIRVSIARLINEARRVRWFARLRGWAPRTAAALRHLFEFMFRRSQICLGHNQFVRLDLLTALGGFPTSGATEDSTLGYAIAARGILVAPVPLLELTDLPETTDKMVRQNARWYKGVLDDTPFLLDLWRRDPSAFNLPSSAPRGQQGGGMAHHRRGLPRHRLPRLALRLLVRGRALLFVLGWPPSISLGCPSGWAASSPRTWSKSHAPLSAVSVAAPPVGEVLGTSDADVLAPGHARGLAGLWALRAQGASRRKTDRVLSAPPAATVSARASTAPRGRR
jgi:hypothetical protein